MCMQLKTFFVSVEVPDLNRLIFESDDNELRDLKWQLLFWTLSIDVININFGAFSEIRDELKPVVVTLLFLRKVSFTDHLEI